jgi:hypothetical protein
MTDKTLIGIGVAAVITPLAAFLYFNGPGNANPKPPEAPKTAAVGSIAPAAKLLPPPPKPVMSINAREAVKAENIAVTPAVLEKLAQSVQLSQDENEKTGNKKELWARVLPTAQKMVDFSDADCEQRNWLTQFVACGQRALDNSPDYYQYARGLATMPRDNQELGSGVPSQ